MSEGNLAEAQLYDQTCQLLKIHSSLLEDAERNRTFYQAIARTVKAGSSVLDIGSGTGIWAIAAARLGAQRVVAVEREELLVGLIRELARNNGVADRVEVIHGDVGHVELKREFDVVISETIGHLIFDEQIVQIMIDARKRFLKSEGVLIPGSVALVVAPARLKAEHGKLPVAIDLEYGYFEALLRNVPVGLTGKTQLEILGETRDLTRLDLTTVESPPDPSKLKAVWAGLDMRSVGGFAVWAEANLSAAVNVTTIDTTSWSTLFYPVRPSQFSDANVEFDLVLTGITNYWTLTVSAGKSREVQSYSPAFASTELLARTRTTPAQFDYLKSMGFLPGKSSE